MQHFSHGLDCGQLLTHPPHPPLPLPPHPPLPLSIMYFKVYMHICNGGRTPSGLLPWDSHQTMTSVVISDTGRPNGDQRHPLVPCRPSGMKHMPGCGCCLPPVWAKHNHKPKRGAGVFIQPACKRNQMAFTELYVTPTFEWICDVTTFHILPSNLMCHHNTSFVPMSIQDVVKINLLGSIYVTQALLPSLKKRKGGAIVFISSQAGQVGVLQRVTKHKHFPLPSPPTPYPPLCS